jgi:putative two-component system response regulator
MMSIQKQIDERTKKVNVGADLGSVRILVVDDDPAIRDLLRLILEMENFEIEVAPDGQGALSLLERIEKPDLILLDLMMPTMNGWQLYSALQEDARFRDIPVVVMTAYSSHEIEMPPVDILPKPIEFPRLLELVEKYRPASKLRADWQH